MEDSLLGGINYTFLYRHSPFNVLKCKQHVLDRISGSVEQQRTRSGTAACATFVTLLIQHDFRRPSGGRAQRSWHKRRWGGENQTDFQSPKMMFSALIGEYKYSTLGEVAHFVLVFNIASIVGRETDIHDVA